MRFHYYLVEPECLMGAWMQAFQSRIRFNGGDFAGPWQSAINRSARIDWPAFDVRFVRGGGSGVALLQVPGGTYAVLPAQVFTGDSSQRWGGSCRDAEWRPAGRSGEL